MVEEIRPARPDEVDSYINMGAQAFQVDAAGTAHWRKAIRPEEIRGLFVDGQMRAGLVLHDMQMGIGGGPVRAGGLGGVATPPEYRRQGYIGRLLRTVLAEMQARDQPLSILYPFSFPFYKHYGWEHASDNHVYTIPIERLPAAPAGGTWHAACIATDPAPPEGQDAVSAADLQVLMGIYDAWAVGRNGLLVRDARAWLTRKLGRRPNAYYWRDPDGTPRAYVLYVFKQIGDWERQLDVREMVALDSTALRAVLGFLRNHDSQAREVHLLQPEDSRLLALLDDPRVKLEVDPGFMLRLVDVPGALRARRYPAAVRGRVVLRVAEGFADRAPHTYALEVAEGRAEALPTTAAPTLSLDQRALGQLYTGYLTPQQAAALGLIQVHDPEGLALAAAVFAGPKPFLTDFF